MKPKSQILRNSRVAALVGLIFATAPSTIFSCGLAWKEPSSSHFEGTDRQGHVSIVERIGEIGGGAGLSEREKTFPIYLIWNSSYGQISPYAGAGFDIPLLSSRMVALDDGGTFKFDQPDGWWRLFWRDKKNPEILNGQGNWKGVIKGDIITLWADCGDKVTLARGRIVQLESKGRKFDYVYSGETVAEIRENGAAVLKVDTDPNTGEVTGLSMGMDKKIGFEWGRRPRIQNIGGNNLIGGMDPGLTKVTLADGTEKSLVFGVDSKLYPTLKVDGNREISWDPVGKVILKDRDWVYDIKSPGDIFANAAIGRSNEIGSEYWFSDSSKGEERIKTLDGVESIKIWFTTGVISGKIREERRERDGKVLSFRKHSYNEDGKLLRVAEGSGQLLYEANYDDGRLVREVVDGRISEIRSENTVKVITTTMPDGLVIFRKVDAKGNILEMTSQKPEFKQAQNSSKK